MPFQPILALPQKKVSLKICFVKKIAGILLTLPFCRGKRFVMRFMTFRIPMNFTVLKTIYSKTVRAAIQDTQAVISIGHPKPSRLARMVFQEVKI